MGTDVSRPVAVNVSRSSAGRQSGCQDVWSRLLEPELGSRANGGSWNGVTK
jgi:hypothetical protein